MLPPPIELEATVDESLEDTATSLLAVVSDDVVISDEFVVSELTVISDDACSLEIVTDDELVLIGGTDGGVPVLPLPQAAIEVVTAASNTDRTRTVLAENII